MRDARDVHSLHALGRMVRPRVGAERVAAMRASIGRRQRRRRVAGIAAATAGVLAACVVVLAIVVRAGKPVAIASTAATAPPSSAAPASATPLEAGTDLAPGPEGDGRSFVLRVGKARFVVAHDESHPFRVVAGTVVVEDVGTVFTVAVTIEGAVAVEVQEGRVRVRRGGTTVDVAGGERRDFAADERPPSGAGAGAEDAGAGAGETSPSAASAVPAVPRWRALAESGRYDDAYHALQSAGPNAVRDDTTELLVAADAARLGGHPADAVPYLERVVAAHGRDPRASLAAFTLGRVLLDELGRPAEAASAFARARGAGGAMAEDALAREVEAFSRAGDASHARELALEYMRTYPKGRRAAAVTKFGGLGGSP
jgi:transmembrane sensor